jgi:hypothetical protein
MLQWFLGMRNLTLLHHDAYLRELILALEESRSPELVSLLVEGVLTHLGAEAAMAQALREVGSVAPDADATQTAAKGALFGLMLRTAQMTDPRFDAKLVELAVAIECTLVPMDGTLSESLDRVRRRAQMQSTRD